MDLAEGQCAVVARVPMRIESAGPVNLHVVKCDDTTCELIASGRGWASLTIRSGDFAIRPAARYVLCRNGVEIRSAVATGDALSFPFELADQVRIGVKEK